MIRIHLAAESLVLSAGLLALTCSPSMAHPVSQRQISRGAVSTVRAVPQPAANHVLFGTLVSVNGVALVMRTRTGSAQRIDATAAIAAGTFSAPLFAGKLVVVGGTFDAAHVLHAQSISRLTRLDATAGPDR